MKFNKLNKICLCFKVIIVLCSKPVFAIELTLQENLVKTGKLRRKVISTE